MHWLKRLFGALAIVLGCIPFFLMAVDNPPPVNHHKFMLITPEKCGTHLLMKALEQLLNKQTVNIWDHNLPSPQLLSTLIQAELENKYVHMHANPSKQMIALLKKQNYKVIFLIRDPRDQALSLLHYIDKGWSLRTLNPKGPYSSLSFNDKLLEIITGNRYGTSGVKHAIGEKLGWMSLESDFVYTVRFENLVGAEGGGHRDLQLMEIRNIAHHLEIDLPDEELQQRSFNLFGKPGEKTFRNGQIGEWKLFFKPMHIKAFKEVFGSELIDMGYECDFNW